MNIVVVGHVDHGKSTVIGRLLADTGSLPEGKLNQVKAMCERTARPFEYAFLLDALKDERAQGITIDTARCFFKTAKRDYIIIDAPGHVEFLKNMVTGAARAEGALLVIDASEGVRENSRRHGYLLSMLGIRQTVILVNKMDLKGYDPEAYESICREYGNFLERLGVRPAGFVPISAREGENLSCRSEHMPWYTGPTVLEHIDAFIPSRPAAEKPMRFPVQDVYKFTEMGDARRIVAGTVESGVVSVGDEVVFVPSGQRTRITTVESFNAPARIRVSAGVATGFTLEHEVYARRGDIMCKTTDLRPHVSTRIKAHVFWMGRAPMVRDKKYKLKLASTRTFVRLVDVVSCVDAVELSSIGGKQQIERHDVAECILETTRPLAFDLVSDNESTGRFVIVDNYDIAGGGIITENAETAGSVVARQIETRELNWDRGLVTGVERERRFQHGAKFIVLSGGARCTDMAKHLERRLFDGGRTVYYLGAGSLERGLQADVIDEVERKEETVRRLGEIARMFTGAGMIFITALPDIDRFDLDILGRLTAPHDFLFVRFNDGVMSEEKGDPHTLILSESVPAEAVVDTIVDRLTQLNVIHDYCI